MLTVPGGRYAVQLQTGGPAGVDPRGWLVGALHASYPGAEIEKIGKLATGQYTAVLRWSKGKASITPGDSVTPVVDGITAPGLPVPSATVAEVKPLTLPTSISVRSEPVDGFEQVDLWKAGVAVALVTTTVYLIHRMSRRDGR